MRKKKLAKLAELQKKRQQEQDEARRQQEAESGVITQAMESDVNLPVVVSTSTLVVGAKEKRKQKCGVCKEQGHNKSTCPQNRPQFEVEENSE